MRRVCPGDVYFRRETIKQCFEYQPGHQGVCRGTKWCQVLGRFYMHELLVWSGSCVSAGGDESTLQVTLLP